jgi:hypothetical protein
VKENLSLFSNYLRGMRILLLMVSSFWVFPALSGQTNGDMLQAPLHNSTGSVHRQRPSLDTISTNLTGVWIGELLQNEGGIAEKFEFSTQLRHHGIFMSGTAYVKLQGIYAEMELSGYQLPNGSWKLTETKILRDSKPEALLWCMKLYELRVDYTADGIILHGPWWGSTIQNPCIPGSVRLKRKGKSA